MPPEPLLTSAGWSLNGLTMQGHRFREIQRVSVSDKNLEVIIRKHEASGVPLVIEGMREHEAWPTDMFHLQWLRKNAKQQIQVRNVRTRHDLEVSFAEFLDHTKSIHYYASVDETSRWYAKDLECPREWKKWLDTTPLIPRSLCPHGQADIMQNLPESGRVETLMCYLGIGDTFTPCHKDLCASFGHNLMCYTEDGGSAFWFMTDSSAAPSMAKYFQSLGQELDLESHSMSIEELAAAPCDVYITEQKVGDLVLVPPRSCHQVVNHCGLSVKMSWSRMTIRSAQVALHHELPIYRRVCRAETYRTKSVIHHTLRRRIALLEDQAKRRDGSAMSHDIFRRLLANDLQTLLELFREIIQDEYHPDAGTLDHVIRDFSHNVYDSEGYPTFSCDFCGSDIFVGFFCCRYCTLSTEKPSSVSDGLHICPGCYAEGRSCGCGRFMEPMQCWPLQILYADHNRAVRTLRGIGVDTFSEVSEILDDSATSTLEAGTAIQKWRREFVPNNGVTLCHAKAQPHATHDAVILHCQKCRKGRCFIHLAEAGVHSSEAIAYHIKSLDHSLWHNLHLSRQGTFVSDKEAILAAEVSGDSFSNLKGQKLAIIALLYPHCQPLNTSYIKFGWYDRPRSNGRAALGPFNAMDMSFPRLGDDWGSPLTDISPEGSVSNTLTPPRDPDSAKPGLSRSAAIQSSASVAVEPMKRKRSSFVFDGVAPPERRRKTNAGHADPSPSAAPRSRSVTSVKGIEKSQLEGPQSTQPSIATLEGSLVEAISKIEALTTTIAEQNRKIEMLIQDNTDRRDEIRTLSQTLQLSGRDLQRVKHMVPEMTSELKVEFENLFEKLLEKSENRIQGPVDRLLEELGRIRFNPPTPVHGPGITQYSAPEPPAGDGDDWAPRDYGPAELNRQNYQENCDRHGQPNPKYGRGGFRPFRGRGRGGARGGYSGSRPSTQRSALPEGYEIVRVSATPSTPTAAPLEPVPNPVLTSIHVVAATPRHSDAYRPQGHAPPPQQHPHTPSSHSHTTYPHPWPFPTTRPRPHSHSHAHSHAHADRDSRQILPASAPQPSRQRSWQHASHPPVNKHARDHEHPRPLSLLPSLPRSREHVIEDERHHAQVPVATGSSETNEGYRDTRYADSYAAAYSPAQSDEQFRWTSVPSDGGEQRQGQSHSQSPGPGPSRGDAGHGHGPGPNEDARRWRR